MRILIIGAGGREHALAWKLKQNPRNVEIFTAPGNGGTAQLGTNLDIRDSDIDGLLKAVGEHKIDFVIPGPELPLVLGIVDACEKAGIPCFGPKAQAAALEGSKAFAKNVMKEAGVPTAAFEVFTDYEKAAAYVREKGAPLVVKADGLAAGKGVVVARTEAEALEAVEDMLVKKVFGTAGSTIVIEDALSGEEVSFLAFCDGKTVLPLPSAQDHKAVYDNDQGPNTGGMGAYSPAGILPENRYQEMIDLVMKPVLAVMEKKGCPFKGVLYAGLMMTPAGPQVLEFNVRFGDPECQPLLMRLESDLLEVMQACASGNLAQTALKFTPETSICVVVTAKGYPGDYPKGMEITGLENANASCPGKVMVFQAGTKPKNNNIISSGGRVLGVTSLGQDLKEAQARAYTAIKQINMPDSFYRTDIGNKGLKK